MTDLKVYAASLRLMAQDFDADGMTATASDYRESAKVIEQAAATIQKLTAQRDHARRHLARIGEQVANASAGFDLDL